MKTSGKNDKKKSAKITEVGISNDTLTSRGGLNTFVRYLDGTGIYAELERSFGGLRKSAKGKDISDLFKQLFCFLADGTSRRLTYFDQLKDDRGYAAGIETDPEDMASSHVMKGFLGSFTWPLIWRYRKIIKQVFICRLHITKPDVVVIDIDSMVMDNDEAAKRHGVLPTYKKKKGFHPIQATWNGMIVDAFFQGGNKHCNHGDTVEKMIKHLVADIRVHYRFDVPIIFSLDSGYFDQKLLETCELLDVGYVCGGEFYKDIKEYLAQVPVQSVKNHDKNDQSWEYVEFGDKAASWSKYRRAVFCRPKYENRQQLLEFARADTLIYTNLGMGQMIDDQLISQEMEECLTPDGCITLYHGRGRNELVNRAFKDFGFEELPFKRFAPNATVYYVMVLAFSLFQSFKTDVLSDQGLSESYASTVRRKLFDVAGKIVKTGGRIILKVAEAAWTQLNFAVIWKESGVSRKIRWDMGF